MTVMFDVQRGVPLPSINRSPKSGRRKYPVDTMAVGDMFFLPGRSAKSVSAYISRITKDRAERFSARHVWMWEALDGSWQLVEPGSEGLTPGAVEGTGVWRIA